MNNIRERGIDFKLYNQRLFFWGEKRDRSLQDLIFVYTILSMVFLAIVSLVVNHILELPEGILWFNYSIVVVLILFYLWVCRAKDIKLIRYLFLIVAIFSTGFQWIFTEGSSGPSILFIQGYVTLLVFISIGKEFNIILSILVLTTVMLFIFEYFFPDFIMPYSSKSQKTWDSLSLILLLMVVEIPILIYARNALFQERNMALESAEAKSFILANMSHEIRTPMNAIIGFTELMADPNIEKHDRNNYLKIVNQNSRTLMNLLNNVINISKIESGNAHVYISEVNINEVIKFVFETLKSLCVNSDTELKVEYLKDEEAICEVDENLLFQIIVNLGYNAIKFTQSGTITIKTQRDNKCMILSVKDTGCGIPANQQHNLFERFRQVNNELNMVPSNGAGLGLSICKGLTDLLQGEIWFTSKENVGSEFFIKFPLVSNVNKN